MIKYDLFRDQGYLENQKGETEKSRGTKENVRVNILSGRKTV